MKYLLILSISICLASCTVYKVYPVTVQVVYPKEGVQPMPMMIGDYPQMISEGWINTPIYRLDTILGHEGIYLSEKPFKVTPNSHKVTAEWKDYDDVIISIQDPKTP